MSPILVNVSYIIPGSPDIHKISMDVDNDDNCANLIDTIDNKIDDYCVVDMIFKGRNITYSRHTLYDIGYVENDNITVLIKKIEVENDDCDSEESTINVNIDETDEEEEGGEESDGDEDNYDSINGLNEITSLLSNLQNIPQTTISFGTGPTINGPSFNGQNINDTTDVDDSANPSVTNVPAMNFANLFAAPVSNNGNAPPNPNVNLLLGVLLGGMNINMNTSAELTEADETNLSQLENMGFDRERAKEVYIQMGRNMDMAVNILLGGLG